MDHSGDVLFAGIQRCQVEDNIYFFARQRRSGSSKKLIVDVVLTSFSFINTGDGKKYSGARKNETTKNTVVASGNTDGGTFRRAACRTLQANLVLN